ncbi:MAG: septum formation initiator family protein [Candidatus Humimicrobiaceae bacterium]
MKKRVKVISSLSRKAKFNILAIMFLVFIASTVFFSLNQIKDIVGKKEKIVELEEKLSYVRNENIRLLAEEKILYTPEGIREEARKQFNMASSNEENYFINTTDEESKDINNEVVVYSNTNLWQNIKLFYNNEINN